MSPPSDFAPVDFSQVHLKRGNFLTFIVSSSHNQQLSFEN